MPLTLVIFLLSKNKKNKKYKTEEKILEKYEEEN